MRAPLSQLASDVMADPQAAKVMRQWIDNPATPLDLTVTKPDGTRQFVRVTHRATLTATHGMQPVVGSLSWPQRIYRFGQELLALIINPVG